MRRGADRGEADPPFFAPNVAWQEQATADLNNFYEYCRAVETELATFDFAEKRLALEALGVQMRASGRE